MKRTAENYHNKFYGSETEGDDSIARENNRIKRYYQSLPLTDKECCDYGCGTGYWTRMLSDFGASVTGTDLSNEMLQYCEAQNINAQFLSLQEISSLRFDYVFANWVLQETIETKDIEETINLLLRVCKENGMVVVVDNVSPDTSKAELMFKDNYGSVYSYKDGTKMRFFDEGKLEEAFRKQGFSVTIYDEFEESFIQAFVKSNS